MPRLPPPGHIRTFPARAPLPAGTRLWRVHDRRYPSDSFNPRAARTLYGGSRFDGTSVDSYGVLYAALAQTTSLAEVLLRGLGFDQRGARTITREKVRNRCLSSLAVTTELSLVSLRSAPDLAAVCQDEWLIQAGEGEYPQTRDWAHWIRRQAPWAQGIVWLSKRDLPQHAVVLFGDRCPPGALRPGPGGSRRLDDEPGSVWLNGVLARYRVCVRPPRPAAAHPGSTPSGSALRQRA